MTSKPISTAVNVRHRVGIGFDSHQHSRMLVDSADILAYMLHHGGVLAFHL